MNRQELAHILRASCTITGDANVVIIGSQAILGTYDESALPEVTMLSREADVAFLNDPDRRKADDVEGAIGEMSPFHDTHRIYAEGVHIETAELPQGWQHRLVTWRLKSSDPATPKFVEPHDLVVSKLAAGRNKDSVFAASLLDAQLVDRDLLFNRAASLPTSSERVSAWLTAYQRRPTARTATPTGRHR